MNTLTNTISLPKATPLLLLKILALALFIWHCMRILLVPFPIFGSDEYAFLVHGLHDNEALIYQLDPNMQRIGNPFFTELHGAIWRYAGEQGIYVSRFLHLLEWIGSIWLILEAIPFFKNRATAYWLAGGVMMAVPSSFFMLSLMPDTEMVLVFSVLFFSVSRLLPHKIWMFAVLSGILCGIGVLIKPHAVAWLAAVMALLILVLFNRFRLRELRALEYLSPLLVVAGCYATYVIGYGWLEGSWNLNPVQVVRQGVYGNILASPVQSGALDWIRLLSYVAVHFLVLFFLFGFALFGMLEHLLGFLKKRSITAIQLSGAFLFLFLGAVICMVAYFTYGAGLGNPFEANRVHGRYLLQLLIFIPVCSYLALGQLTERGKLLLGIMGLVSSFLFYYAFRYYFKIFPWDYPELFAFYQSPNHYSWNYDIGLNLGIYLLMAYALSYVMVLVRPSLAKYALLLQFIILLSIGNLNMRDWSRMNSELYGVHIEAGKTIGKLIPKSEPGEVAVIGDQRFGDMAYFLSGLSDRHQPAVVIKTAGTEVTRQEMAPYKWIILQKQYLGEQVKKQLKIGNYTLLSNELECSLPEKGEWGETSYFSTLGRQSEEIFLSGFNEREDWGAWTASENAVIALPFFINPGKLKLKISAWLTPENLANEVRFEIGKTIFRTRMTDVNTAYEFEIDIKERTDRILVSTPVSRPPTSHRYTGVGIAFIEIAR